MTDPVRASTAGRSYVIPCTAPFRDAVKALAERRHASIADLARAVMLLVGADGVAAQPDPGEPSAAERETVRLKSGVSEGRDLLRKPRLQARLPQGLDAATIRKALAIALALDRRELELRVTEAGEAARQHERLERATAEGERLGGLIGLLSFEALPHGVRTRGEALYVLGFPPGSAPELRAVRERFRQLARVHHPDSAFGDSRRMVQLNEAVALLQRRGQV